jgi:hypothetical protein
LPAACLFGVCYAALHPVFFPPSAAKVRKRLAERKDRSEKAHNLDHISFRRKKGPSIADSLAQSISIATVATGLGLQDSSTNEGTSRGIVSSSDSENELMDKLTMGSKKKRKSKIAMYRLGKEVLDRFGPGTMLAISDTADYLEKVKK